MSTRISTSGMHAAALSELLKQQVALSRTQTQVASGQRFQSPAEDPIAATRVLELEQSRAQLAQFEKNADVLANRLQIGEQAMADMSNVLQRVRELAVQANSGAMDASARASIATEIEARTQELMDIANRRDANGEYLFAGYSTSTRPFVRGAGGVSYAGDEGTRLLQIGPDQKVADSNPGSELFMRVPEGNGTFTTAQGVHAGTGSIDTGQVTNQAAWVRDTYTLGFTTPGSWEVRDSANTVVASGAYTAGSTITFRGIGVTVTGEPAAGDSFVIAPAATDSVFDTLDRFVAALRVGADNPSGRSTLNTEVARALNQIDQ